MVVAVAESGQLSEIAPVVDSCLMEGSRGENGLWIWAESLFAGSDFLLSTPPRRLSSSSSRWKIPLPYIRVPSGGVPADRTLVLVDIPVKDKYLSITGT
jgi:hypothetical protein